MKLTTLIPLLSLHVLSATCLSLSEVDAATSDRLTAELHRKRGLGGHKTQPGRSGSGNANVKREDEFYISTSWSGAVAGDGRRLFESVSASVVVPEPTFPWGFNSSETYTASAWVGIGGIFTDTDTSLIQSGFYYSWQPEGNGGNAGMYAFYEWFPGPPIWYHVSDVHFGDQLNIKVSVDDTRIAGRVFYENLSREPIESVALDVKEGGDIPVDGLSADWIVENWIFDGENLPDYGVLTFTDIAATFDGGAKVDLTDPTIYAWPVQLAPYASKGNDTIVFPGTIDAPAGKVTSSWGPWK